MRDYHIRCANGYFLEFMAKNDILAKRYASKRVTPGCGYVTLYGNKYWSDDKYYIAKKFINLQGNLDKKWSV